jgi:hypothetical protein
MNKSDLKTGMRVETREGYVYLVLKDVETKNYGHQNIVFVNDSFILGDDYNENLIKNKSTGFSSNYDIMKVYEIETGSSFNSNVLNLNERILVWERQEYTEEQKEIFKALKTLGFNWICRDSNDKIYAFNTKPYLCGHTWVHNGNGTGRCASIDKNLDFIKKEDMEPFEIPS